MTSTPEQKWFQDHVLAYELGLLEAEERSRFEALLATDGECRALHGRLRESAKEEPPDHIPASVLARWERTQTTLRGAMRAMARQHLQRCAQCRQELEFLGHRASLPVIDGLEADPAPVATSVPEGLASPASTEAAADAERKPLRVVPGGAGRRRMMPLVFGWSSLATAAAVLLAFQNVFLQRRLGVQLADRPPVSGGEPTQNLELADEPLVMRLRPDATWRGNESPQSYRLRPGATELFVTLAITERVRSMHAGTRILLQTRGPRADAPPLARKELAFDALAEKGALVLRNGGAPLEPGNYAVEAFATENGKLGSKLEDLSWQFLLLP